MLAQSIGFLALVGSALSAQTPPTVQDVAAQSNALASSLVVPDVSRQFKFEQTSLILTL